MVYHYLPAFCCCPSSSHQLCQIVVIDVKIIDITLVILRPPPSCGHCWQRQRHQWCHHHRWCHHPHLQLHRHCSWCHWHPSHIVTTIITIVVVIMLLPTNRRIWTKSHHRGIAHGMQMVLLSLDWVCRGLTTLLGWHNAHDVILLEISWCFSNRGWSYGETILIPTLN